MRTTFVEGLEFSTKLLNNEVEYHSNASLIEYDNLSATIGWSVDFEVREYGIKEVYVTVSSVSLFGDFIDISIKDNDDEVSFTKDFSMDEYEVKIIKNIDNDLSLYPREIYINEVKKLIEIWF